jgi:hypothetical protein
MEQPDTLRPTGIKETNSFYIHQIHLRQIQRRHGITTLDLGFHQFDVFGSEAPAAANPRSPFPGNPFELQRSQMLLPTTQIAKAPPGPTSSPSREATYS